MSGYWRTLSGHSSEENECLGNSFFSTLTESWDVSFVRLPVLNRQMKVNREGGETALQYK